MPAVSDEHTWITGYLITLFTCYVSFHDAGKIGHEPYQMKLSSTGPGRQPDIFFVKKKNLKRLKPMYCAGPADLVVEVISKGNTKIEMENKLTEYFERGVALVWYIYPLTKSAIAYTSPSDFEHIDASGTLHGGQVLPGFELKLDKLF